MARKPSRIRKKAAVPWGAVAFAMLITFGLLFWAVWMSWPRQQSSIGVRAGAAAPGGQAEPKTPLEDFMDALRDERYRPDFPLMQRPCPLHPQEELQVPVKRLVGERFDIYGDNSFGGVATDLMKIALGPPESGERIGEPSMAVQDFDSLLASCAESGATFSMTDLQRLKADPAAADRLVGWDLLALAPELAARPQSEWTIDERCLVRLLTQKRWGASSVELGFTALTGAYISNFSVYRGRDYRLEGAAWYALAAAYFEQALSEGSLQGESQILVTRMTLGELYRLLGDTARAGELYAEVKSGGSLPKGSSEVLEQMIELAQQGSSNLERASVQDVPVPPVGWYLDRALPAINGQLAVTRQQWGPSGLGSDWGQPEAVLGRIMAGLSHGATSAIAPADSAAASNESTSDAAADEAAADEETAGH
ncbi:hypothetical protein IT575_12370 [bacterium]|nr:hypothetical protein [bacterium]